MECMSVCRTHLLRICALRGAGLGGAAVDEVLLVERDSRRRAPLWPSARAGAVSGRHKLLLVIRAACAQANRGTSLQMHAE